MKTVHILGISRDTFVVIADLLNEQYGTEKLKIHSNIAEDIHPLMPNKVVDYELISIDSGYLVKGNVFFGTSGPKNKESILKYFQNKCGIERQDFLKIIHSSSYIANSSIIDPGVMIEPHAVVSSQSNIGFGVFIKRGSLVGHHNVIGEFSDINPGVVISGKVNIGKGCIIGSGSVIKDNISIGKNSIIGIGSVVTKDIPENSIAYGNPCKVMKQNDK